MARNTLTDRQVRQARKPGVLIDGGGLRLRITANKATGAIRKSWLLRIKIKGGPTREIGLGSAHDLTLKDARERALAARKLALDGVDPLAHRQAVHAARAAEAARAMTFRQCAQAYIDAHRAGWRNAKHAAQWNTSLEKYAYPVFGDLPVSAIDVTLVLKALEPNWKQRTETASRVRQRIEAILDWAKARELRQGENPARWRGHLDKILPARTKVQRVKHHAAMPYRDVAGFMAGLSHHDSTSTSALQMLILTAARTSEVLKARWSEIDLTNAVWLVPGERMKSGRDHRVPLSKPVLALLKSIHGSRQHDAPWVFPGAKAGEPLSNMTLLQLMTRMGADDFTVHGFRSSFRDWAAEQTNFPREVAEAALAHVVGDKVEAAYRRGDLFEKRRQLMEAWAKYCRSPRGPGEVVPIVKAG